jgi:YVTN family beta-propeller protein
VRCAGKGLSRWPLLGCLLLVATATAGPTAAAAPPLPRAGTPGLHLPTHINADGTAVLPDGRLSTPAGRTIPVDLVPLNVVLSHDGRRLYVSDEGEDNVPKGAADDHYDRFVSVVDTATMRRTRVEDSALQSGLAESPDGRELYASEGSTDSMGVFGVSAEGGLAKVASVPLQAHDFPWGMALSPDGRYAYIAPFMSNTLNVVDTRTRTLVGHVDTGEFPYSVAVSGDGRRLYVSNMGVSNTEAAYDKAGLPAPPVATTPTTAAGYNMPQSSSVWTYDISNPVAPAVATKTRIGRDVNGWDVLSGSLPGALALSPDGARLAVTASNDDIVAILDARGGNVVGTVDLHAFPGGPTGDQPNAVAWSPDGSRLFVAEGGRNAVAVIDARTATVLGRIPTGWYPSALAVSGDGRMLYIASAKGLGTGPNGALPTGPTANNDHYPGYIGSLLRGTVQQVDLGGCPDLATLTAEVARNDGLTGAAGDPQPGDAVVPATYGAPSPLVKHVVFILKENRTYDQILGDLPGTERDQSLAAYSGKVTPNVHGVASQFAVADNFYTTSQSSTDGHFLYGTGHENEFTQKTVPSTQANAFQGSAAGIVNTSAENLPIGGFLWHNAARSGISTRIYGEADYLIGLGPNDTPVPAVDVTNSASIGLLQNTLVSFSPTYPTNVQSGVDEQRADDVERELKAFAAAGTMPALSYLALPDDHTDGATPGRPTPESFISQNDHALGRIVDAFSHSSFWANTVIFVTEDDTQGGQDHVDAQRTVMVAAGPYVRHGYVSHLHHSTASLLKTVDLLIGAAPTSLQEFEATPMTDMFQPQPQLDPRFTAVPRQVSDGTNPTAATAANADQRDAALLQEQIPPGVDHGGSLLPEVLALAHRGAVQAGDASVPATPAVAQHTLARGDVPIPTAPAGRCDAAPLSSLAASVPGAVVGTPNTSGAAAGRAASALALLVLAALPWSVRRRTARTRNCQDRQQLGRRG